MADLPPSTLPPDALPPQTHAASIPDRIARGRALRERSPRKSHAVWSVPADRRDPIDTLIEEGRARVQELLPLRYARMKASPFAFLRGSAGVMAADLSRTARTGVFVHGLAATEIAGNLISSDLPEAIGRTLRSLVDM